MIEEVQHKLFTATHQDWDVNINFSLTEPTSVCITVCPEYYSISRYTFWCDRDFGEIQETLEKLLKIVVDEILNDKISDKTNPYYTNPDDTNFLTWLRRSDKCGENFPEPVKETLSAPA
jgi:hypothetical protein